MTFMEILGSMAEGGVAAYDTKAYTAIKATKRAEEKSEREEKRLEAELSLKEQQIKQAKIKTALQEDSKKAAELTKKFNLRNQDPSVAAEMYNSMDFEDEMQFDTSHFESTASGGKRQAAHVEPTQAGQTEDRLKPDAERKGALVGATDGEYRFKTGYYERDDKGQKILGSDGKPKFVETGAPVLYKNKQEMIDDVSQLNDPKLRTAMALKELGIDEFLQKSDIKVAGQKEVGAAGHEQRIEQIKESGTQQQKTASIYAAAKSATAGTRGSMTEAQRAAAERAEIDDFRKSFEVKFNKEMFPDEDPAKQTFNRKEMKGIMNLEQHEEFGDAFKALKKLNPGAQNVKLQKLKDMYKLPDEYIDYLKGRL